MFKLSSIQHPKPQNWDIKLIYEIQYTRSCSLANPISTHFVIKCFQETASTQKAGNTNLSFDMQSQLTERWRWVFKTHDSHGCHGKPIISRKGKGLATIRTGTSSCCKLLKVKAKATCKIYKTRQMRIAFRCTVVV